MKVGHRRSFGKRCGEDPAAGREALRARTRDEI
jgi:hypothetical protein